MPQFFTDSVTRHNACTALSDTHQFYAALYHYIVRDGAFPSAHFEGNIQAARKVSLPSWSWQYVPTAGVPFDLSGSLASLEPGVRFEIDIVSRRLEHLVLSVRGQAVFQAVASFDSGVSTLGSTRSIELLRDTSLGSIVITALVPFHIQAFLRLDAVMQATAAVPGVSMLTGVRATAAVEYGVSMDRGFWGTSWRRIASEDWHQEVWLPSFSPSAQPITLSGAVSIEPQIFLTVNWLGGPTATLSPYISTVVDAGPTTDCGATVGWGIEAHVGAQMDVRNPFTGTSLASTTLVSQEVTGVPFRELFECDCSPQCQFKS